MKKRYNIIISSYDDLKNPYYGGGGAIAIHEVAKRLASQYKITILTGKYKNCKEETIDSVLYKRVGLSTGNPKVDQLIFQIVLPLYVAFMQFDLWIENFTPPFSTAFLQKFTSHPVIGLVHMLSAKDMERKYLLPFHLVENVGLKTYQQFIVLSSNLKNIVSQQNKQAAIAVIPNGVSLSQVTLSKTKKHILYVGRIEVDQKGLDLLVEAYSKVYNKINLPLVIAGTGVKSELLKLNQLINKHSLQNRVILVGKVKGEKKNKLLKEAVTIVVPSRFETFSLMALEALACGIPLISFNIDGLSWIPRNMSIQCKQFSTNDLASAIKKICTSKNQQSNLSKKSKEHFKTQTWNNIANQYREYIDSTLGI